MKRSILLLTMVLAGFQSTFAQNKKSASAILTEYLNSVGTTSAQNTASYFAKDGSIELPYLASFGMQDKFTGQDAIIEVVSGLLKNAPNFRMKNIKIIASTNDTVFAEYDSEATIVNGRTYNQHYMGYAIIKNGKIVLHREVMNTVNMVRALFPNGLKDIE